MAKMEKADLHKRHTKEAIRERLSQATKHSYIGDTILGAIDGLVTTFAVICGVAGAGIQSQIAIILGMANLLADGFSMAVGNYLRAKSDHEFVAQARRIEEAEIEQFPEGEREEVRQIFQNKGFEGPVLEQAVDIITKDKKQWIDIMITDELGLRLENPHPVRAAVSTFAAFCVVGLIPLLPYLIITHSTSPVFKISSFITGLTFFAVGWVKGKLLKSSPWRSGIETLLVGGTAAVIAYMIALFTKNIVGI